MATDVMRYAVAPRFKGIGGFDAAELAIIYDSIPISTDADQFSGSTFRFFPTVADPVVAYANYIRNPLPKTRPYDIVGCCVGFDFNTLTVLPGEQATLDLPALWNSLSDAEVTFETSEQDELWGKHIQELALWDDAGISLHPSDDAGTGDGITKILHWPKQKVMRLEDPLHLESQEVFDVDIELQDNSGIPSDADWSSLGKETPRIYFAMQVVYRESSMQGG